MLLKLRPNCLLTRYPLVILTAQEGFTSFLRPSRWYAAILRDHGYQVVRLSVKDAQDQKLNQFLNQSHQQGRRLHLLCEAKIRNGLDFDQLPTEALASLTTLHFAPVGIRSFFKSLSIGQKKKWREQILNLAISLAENDLKCSH